MLGLLITVTLTVYQKKVWKGPWERGETVCVFPWGRGCGMGEVVAVVLNKMLIIFNLKVQFIVDKVLPQRFCNCGNHSLPSVWLVSSVFTALIETLEIKQVSLSALGEQVVISQIRFLYLPSSWIKTNPAWFRNLASHLLWLLTRFHYFFPIRGREPFER